MVRCGTACRGGLCLACASWLKPCSRALLQSVVAGTVPAAAACTWLMVRSAGIAAVEWPSLTLLSASSDFCFADMLCGRCAVLLMQHTCANGGAACHHARKRRRQRRARAKASAALWGCQQGLPQELVRSGRCCSWMTWCGATLPPCLERASSLLRRSASKLGVGAPICRTSCGSVAALGPGVDCGPCFAR